MTCQSPTKQWRHYLSMYTKIIYSATNLRPYCGYQWKQFPMTVPCFALSSKTSTTRPVPGSRHFVNCNIIARGLCAWQQIGRKLLQQETESRKFQLFRESYCHFSEGDFRITNSDTTIHSCKRNNYAQWTDQKPASIRCWAIRMLSSFIV